MPSAAGKLFTARVERVDYRDPWSESFADRLRSLRNGQRRVAYLYQRLDNTTFRYRVYNMIQALRNVDGVGAAYFTESEIQDPSAVVRSTDVLVICRWLYGEPINRVVTLARRLGKRVLFDVDDLVFDADYAHLIMHTLYQNIREERIVNHWFSYIARIGATMKQCDEVIVTNPELAERAHAFSGRQTHVIPNFLNEEQLALSRTIFEKKRLSRFERAAPILLGYFSGTASHNRDFRVISEALTSLLSNDHRIKLRVVGFVDLDKHLHRHMSRIEVHPLQDFLNLQRLIGETEFNLVPLEDNVFTNCKSELKFFEAAIVGTLTAATPTSAFRSAMGAENGYLVNSLDWEDALRQLVDEGLEDYAQRAERAHAYALATYAPARYCERISTLLFDSRTSETSA